MILHFLSTGPKFPYSYYLGVMTALKAHKGEIKLWITEVPKSKYFNLLTDKVHIEMVKEEIPDFPPLRNKSDHFKRVAIFDYLIWRIAYREGGIIMGLDSVTLKDWQDLLEPDKEMLVPRDAKNDGMSFSMHGVIVRKGSQMAKEICELAELSLTSDDMRFGDAGILPYLHVVHHHIDKVTIADYGLVGGCNQDGKPFYLWRKDGELLHPDTRTIPMYATSEAKTFNKIDEDYIANSGTLLSRLVKGITPKNKYRFHLLGLVHLPVSDRYRGCAFTQKIVKLSKMLLDLGHEVILYGSEGSDAPCTYFVKTHELKNIRKAWGEGDNRFELGYDWQTKGFKHDFNATKTEVTKRYYKTCIEEINRVKKQDDFLLLSQGNYQKPIADAVNLHLTCEPGVGYRGSYSKFRAFESAYLQNFTYGSEHPRKSINGSYYDRVIPNYFNPQDFKFQEKKDDYFIYLGRVTRKKGVNTAIKVCDYLKKKLIIAGQSYDKGIMESPYTEFVGYADKEKRANLLAGAKAAFVPSIYLEAFGGVAVEAMLSGTPIITTNFGVFPEYNINDTTGYRCNTLSQFVEAAKKVETLNPKAIREYAVNKFSMDVVKWQYQEWFEDLYQLYLSATDPTIKGWHYIKQ